MGVGTKKAAVIRCFIGDYKDSVLSTERMAILYSTRIQSTPF